MIELEEIIEKLKYWDEQYAPKGYMAQAATHLEKLLEKIDELKSELDTAYQQIEELNAEINDSQEAMTVSYMFGYERGKDDADKK